MNFSEKQLVELPLRQNAKSLLIYLRNYTRNNPSSTGWYTFGKNELALSMGWLVADTTQAALDLDALGLIQVGDDGYDLRVKI